MTRPDVRCSRCGGPMKRKSRSVDCWGGCLVSTILILVGLVGSPFLIGIPILAAGALLLVIIGFKRETYWACRSCGSTFKNT